MVKKQTTKTTTQVASIKHKDRHDVKDGKAGDANCQARTSTSLSHSIAPHGAEFWH